jgi:putative ABC transport system permease protein
MTRARPPRLAAWIVRLSSRTGDRPYILADLDEEFAQHAAEHGRRSAAAWYWRQALASAVHLAGGRLRDRGLDATQTAGASHETPRVGAGLVDLTGDLRRGCRLLLQRRAVSSTAIATLAISVGAAATMFAAVDAALLRPLPLRDADRVVLLWENNPTRGLARDDVAPANFFDWREQAQSFDALAAVEPYTWDVDVKGEPQVIFGLAVTERFLEALGVDVSLGRGFALEDHRPGAPRVAVITDGAWRRRFGASRQAIGASITLDGVPHTIVGVLARSARVRLLPTAGEREIWVPRARADYDRVVRESGWWNVVGRLASTVTLEQARADMDRVSAVLAAKYPATNADARVLVQPLREQMLGDVRTALIALFAAVICVLLIACANIANLLIAAGAERRAEFAVRAALGASRARLARQLLVEHAALAAAGAAAGLALAHLGVRLVATMGPASAPVLQEAAVDARVTAFAAAAATLATLLFGVAPALHADATMSAVALRAAGRGGAGAPRLRRLRSTLLVAQIAAALVLLAGAGLLLRSFVNVLNVHPGFDTSRLLTLQVFAADRQPTPERRRAYFAEALQRLRALPGVERATAASTLPFAGEPVDLHAGVTVIGAPSPPDGKPRTAFLTVVADDYFRVIDQPLRAGRLFDDRDSPAAAPAAIVNETFARRYIPDGTALGRQIVLQAGRTAKPIAREIVGVVADTPHGSLDGSPRPDVFYPHPQHPYGGMIFVVRTSAPPETLTAAVKAQIWSVDPQQPFYSVATMDETLAATLTSRRFSLTLAAGFAVTALLLAAVGVYGLATAAAAQRRTEFGVRVALGASASSIGALAARDGLRAVGLGAVLGALAAAALTRFLRGLLYGVTPLDPVVFAGAAAMLAIAALAACAAPARRAARVDPATTLRAE